MLQNAEVACRIDSYRWIGTCFPSPLNVCFFYIVIDDSNFQDVLTELNEVAHKWKPVGFALGCSDSTLTQIEQEPTNHSAADCLSDMLAYRKNQLKPCRLTWKEIIKALRVNTVSGEVLANRIAEQHCQSEYLKQPPSG